MIEREVRDSICRAGNDESFTFVVEVTGRRDIERIARLPDRRQRRAALRQANQRAKEELVRYVRSGEGAEVRDVSGSRMFAVTAPVRTWRHLIDAQSPLAREQDVRVMPNRRFEAL